MCGWTPYAEGARLRFLNRRRIFAALGILVVAILMAIGGIIAYLKSSAFEARARSYIVEEIERRTGATVTLKTFDWSFWHQRFHLEDLILRGLEPADHAPLARFGSIDIGLNFRTLLEHRIDLYEL